jgi:hypothetical protein
MTRRNVYGLVGFQHVVTNEFHMTFLDTSMEPPSIRWLT